MSVMFFWCYRHTFLNKYGKLTKMIDLITDSTWLPGMVQDIILHDSLHVVRKRTSKFAVTISQKCLLIISMKHMSVSLILYERPSDIYIANRQIESVSVSVCMCYVAVRTILLSHHEMCRPTKNLINKFSSDKFIGRLNKHLTFFAHQEIGHVTW